MADEALTVADFFAGAGGFSEGFRQKGFDVVFALDNWEPAIETHKLNHPEAEHVQMDIKDIETAEQIDEVVPDVDVIVGGPPCVNFSMSNKAGKADKTEGLNLIECMLRIIAWKKEHGGLKYWVLENVPQTQNYIKDKYTWEELQLPGSGPDLEVLKKPLHVASDFGVPQSRKRMLAGNYPDIEDNKVDKKKTVREVFDALGDPLKPEDTDEVQDPNFPLSLPKEEVTDHFYDSRVEEYRWKRAKRLKVDHGFMGKMDFPEDLDRPSRTVMATRSASTREAMLFGAEEGEDSYESYRLPTVREISSFMSYPITYEFEASTEAKKYRLVGNSVPTKLAGALAEAIAEEEGMEVPDEFLPLPDVKTSNDLTGRERDFREPRPRPEDSTFDRHVPFLKVKAFRPSLTNKESDFENDEHVWSAVLHKGNGSNHTETMARKEDIRELFEEGGAFTQATIDDLGGMDGLSLMERLDALGEELQERFDSNLPDAEKFHMIYTRREEDDGYYDPYEALEEAKEAVDENFPEEEFSDVYLDNSSRIVDAPDDQVPVRIAAGQYAAHFIADSVNGGGI